MVSMLASLLVLAPLCYLSNGNNTPINVCFISVPTQANAAVVRPSVPVANCQDRDAAACYEIFKPDNPGMTFANNLMP